MHNQTELRTSHKNLTVPQIVRKYQPGVQTIPEFQNNPLNFHTIQLQKNPLTGSPIRCPHNKLKMNVNKIHLKHPGPTKQGHSNIFHKRHEHYKHQMMGNMRHEVQPEVIKKCAKHANQNAPLPIVNEKIKPPAPVVEKQTVKTDQSPAAKVTHNNIKKPPAPAPVPVNKKKDTSKDTKAKTPTRTKSVPITEIYKNTSLVSEPSNKTIVSASANGNLSFQKVTQDLANIIKNFQQQINEVPTTKTKMEQIPSAMMHPKNKEYFKKNQVKPVQAPNNAKTTGNTNAKTQENVKNQNNNNNDTSMKTKNSKVTNMTKQSSLKTFSKNSRTSLSSKCNIKKFNSIHAVSSRYSRTSNYMDPLKQLKEEVQKAIRDHKTFTIRGHFAPIRRALLSRGWVEKFHVSYKDHLSEELKRYQHYSINELLPLVKKDNISELCKNLIKSKLLGAYQVDFYWGTSYDVFKENPDKVKFTIINKLKRDVFSYTNKQGLCDANKMCYWYQKTNVSKFNHPRSYSLGKNGDTKSFIDDFRVTAAMSLLKWVVKMNETREIKLLSPTGKIPLETFDFALNECCKFIKKGRHEDIDVFIPDASDHEWDQFLDYFYKLVHYNNHFTKEGKETEDSLVKKSNYVLNNLKTLCTYVDMDGMMNIWILKPVASSRGRGIHMCRTLQYALKIVKQFSNVRYVIQKYIERPLLIYNTKFDIRQWFLISCCCPLTIWIYRQSYLRFSSQTYNLRKLHESIHLTNNSVQCKYKNTSLDTALPVYNMWDSEEFQKYLSNIGYPKVFNDIIYPGMKQCITAAVLMHQEKMVARKNSFELYGADFILTEDFQPWLLEINSCPALHASTPVTARMCPKVLEDVIKVVIDYTQNSKANTGHFEMVYKEQLAKLPATATFEVKGVPLRSSYFVDLPEHLISRTQFEPIRNQAPLVNQKTQDYLKVFGDEIKKTLKNLLDIIHNEKKKRDFQRNKQDLNTSIKS